VIGFLAILIFMMILHKKNIDFEVYTKKIQNLMLYHAVLLGAVALTGAIMMAAKHLSFTAANLMMVIGFIVITGIEIKRNKVLAKTVKFKQIEPSDCKKLAFKYHVIEFVILLAVGAFAGMAG
jgi:hypothetical protein